MHILRHTLFIIPATFLLLSCKEQQPDDKDRSLPPKSLPSPSLDLQITEQAEELYQSTLKTFGNTFDVYKAGALDLQQVQAPETFRELAGRLGNDWAIPTWDFSHPVMKFLVTLHKKSPLRFMEGAIRQRNIKSYSLAYSLLTGELRTSPILEHLKINLGEDFSSYMDDPDLNIEWSGNSRSLILKTKIKHKTIIIVPKQNQPQYTQKIKPVPFTSEEIKAMEREYSGSVQLMDNALGKIQEIFIFYNRHLPYKTLVSICRSLGAHVNIVTLPQSRLMHFVDSHIEALKKGRLEKQFPESILSQQSHRSSKYMIQIESMCKENGAKYMRENPVAYINNWKELRNKIFLEEAKNHELTLKRQLKSDGIDLQRITIITTKHLESKWARDYFLLGFTNNRKPVFLNSSIQLIKRNREIAEVLTQAPQLNGKWSILDIHIPFEGGDIRAVGQSVFGGENTFEQSINEIQRFIRSSGKTRVGSHSLISTDRNQIGLTLKKEYEALFGREFILVGEGDNAPQSMMHIDMFLTFLPNPGKKPTVVVADMNETLTLLNGLSDEETAQIERSMLRASLHPGELNHASLFWLYRGLFMRHDLIQIMLHGGLPSYIASYQKSNKRKELQQQLDAVATWFEQRGFVVVRAPTAAPPLCYINFWSQLNGIAILGTIQDNAFRVYNNVLVEMYVDKKDRLHRTIYMPQFGISPLEKRLVEIYNTLGYRVVFVPFMWETAYGRGALDCLTSEVRGRFKEN
ncbi:MAG: hypothetical protein GY847_24850 [Proteobacteria bacterium]|nr:hypothetical protein [Pseudomonadota bacterium]